METIDRTLQKRRARYRRRRKRIAKELYFKENLDTQSYNRKKQALKQDRLQEQKEIREYLLNDEEHFTIDGNDVHPKVRY